MLNRAIDIAIKLGSTEWVKLLEGAGGRVFVVGGTVRDAVLGNSSKDVDLIVENLDVRFIASLLNSRGKVDIVGESFKVVKFKPFGHEGEPYDIATPRMDIKVGSGHKGFETHSVDTVEEDLKRRDFTINSVAIGVHGEVVDPFNGLGDMRRSTLAATDSTAFVEDPLRILRGIQFAARFGFKIEDETLRMMVDNAHLIKEISGERILEEFEKILKKEGDTRLALALVRKTRIDVHLLGKRLEGLYNENGLDRVSFYYALCKTGNPKKPGDFYSERFKGDLKTKRAIAGAAIIENLSGDDEQFLRWVVYTVLQKSPEIRNAVFLDDKIGHVIELMDTGEIPEKPQDILVNGEDAKEMGAYREEIGLALDLFLRSALMQEFDWKNRESSLVKLKNIIDK